MSNASESLYTGSKRSDLEILFDTLYSFIGHKIVLQNHLMEKTGANHAKLKKILEKCESEGFIKSYKLRKRKEYELLEHGKELIYTWLDYVHAFDLKKLAKNRYLEPLPEKGSCSRLKEIIRKPSVLRPEYVKCSFSKKRSPIMLYRDFLGYLNSLYPEYICQEKIRPAIDTTNINFKVLRDFAKERERSHIQIRKIRGIVKWQLRLMRNKELKDLKISRWRKPDQLIRLTDDGIRCLKTFDKIMEEFHLTDFVYTYLKPYKE